MSRLPLLVPVLVGLLALADGCAFLTPARVVAAELTGEQLECVFAAVESGADNAGAVLAACPQIPSVLAKDVESVIGAQRAGHAMAMARKADAGAP